MTSEVVAISRSAAGAEWIYEAPIRWPKGGRLITVTVEELKTGAKGAGSTDLPIL